MRSPTKVDVAHFLNGAGRSDRRRFLLPIKVQLPLIKAEEAKVDLLLDGSDDGIRIRGTIATDVTLNCYRCLEEWHTERVIRFDRTVRRLPDSDGYSLPKDGYLELDGIVIDEVVISLPTAPLCEEDCPGICSGCGVHLSAGACECVDEDRRSPFSVLSELL